MLKNCFFFHRATIELGDITPHNLQQLKRLNQVVFPVSYNDKFYKDILEAGELAKLGMIISLSYSKFLNVVLKSFLISFSILQRHCCRRSVLQNWCVGWFKKIVHYDTRLPSSLSQKRDWLADAWTCSKVRWKWWWFPQHLLVSHLKLNFILEEWIINVFFCSDMSKWTTRVPLISTRSLDLK